MKKTYTINCVATLILGALLASGVAIIAAPQTGNDRLNEDQMYQQAFVADDGTIQVKVTGRAIPTPQTGNDRLSTVQMLQQAFVAADGTFQAVLDEASSGIPFVNYSGLADNDLLQYDTTDSAWENITQASLLHNSFGGLTTGDPHTQYQKESDFTAGSVLFRGATAITQDNSGLFYDYTNKRIGINTTAPARDLEILDTTNPQVRLTHTAGSVYADLQVSSAGNLTITPSGDNIYLPSGKNFHIGGDIVGFETQDFSVYGETGGIILKRTSTNEPFLLIFNDTADSGGQIRGRNAGGLSFTNFAGSTTLARMTTGGFTIGSGAANVDYVLFFDGQTTDGTFTWMEDEGRLDLDSDFALKVDNKKLYFGTGYDFSAYYNGTAAILKTDEVAASDLQITTGAAKTLLLNTPVYDDLNFDPDRSGGPVATQPDSVTINNVFHREFTSANNQLCGAVQELPHGYKLSSTIYPHIHIFLKASETVGTTGVTFTLYWELRQSTGTTSGSVPLAATSAQLGTTAGGNSLTLYDATGFAGSAELGGQLALTIARTAGDAGDVVVTTYGVHYAVDTIGSRLLDTK